LTESPVSLLAVLYEMAYSTVDVVAKG